MWDDEESKRRRAILDGENTTCMMEGSAVGGSSDQVCRKAA